MSSKRASKSRRGIFYSVNKRGDSLSKEQEKGKIRGFFS
jgi:hypothetical protein